MTDAQTIDGLKKQDGAAFEILYKFYFPVVEKFVLQNSGTTLDAEDIFQETILVLLKNVPRDDFKLTSSLKTYIVAIASNLWLKRLREAKSHFQISLDTLNLANTLPEPCSESEQSERLSERVTKSLKKITERCQEILQMVFFQNKKIDDVQARYNYTDRHNAQNQKHKCLQQFKKADES
jgi:RNA polymerase sigma factor (sigma-70 family)